MSRDPAGLGKQGIDLHTDRPHPARVYDYLLGGKDNFAADRAAAEAGLKANPNSRIPPRENRAFLRRAVRYLAREARISQFLDIGTGIPTSPNVHEIAQDAEPRARVVYVDNDPIVLSHARALLIAGPAGKTAYIDADLRDPDKILNSPARRLFLVFQSRLRPGRPAAGRAAARQLPGTVSPDRRLRSGSMGRGSCGVPAQRGNHASPLPASDRAVLRRPGPYRPWRGVPAPLAPRPSQHRPGSPAR